MNPEAQELLDKILAKEPHELTSDDIGFLKARWMYVGKNSRDKFRSVLEQPAEAQSEQAPQQNEQPQPEGEKNKEVEVDSNEAYVATEEGSQAITSTEEDNDGEIEVSEQTDNDAGKIAEESDDGEIE